MQLFQDEVKVGIRLCPEPMLVTLLGEEAERAGRDACVHVECGI